MAKESKKCSGFRKTGYWKGHPCGTSPTINREGRWWCKNHVPEDTSVKWVSVSKEDLSYLLLLTTKYLLINYTCLPAHMVHIIQKHKDHLTTAQFNKICEKIDESLNTFRFSDHTDSEGLEACLELIGKKKTQ